ncbi:hypothetical protein [Moritella sp.]|uniref:hypothetical protein n=1 Tax=Moritella sp. TaxID=78556 RepID=UPI0025F38C2A|nr:hypothetical protein [Moritella sp.]MCJ8351947.1 EndoU domain-containing protein [Moritella sp.]
MDESILHIFYINESISLTISDSAINHILNGDLTDRLVMKDGRRTGETEKLLKGGMHTVDGFLKLKSFHDKIEHLHFYHSDVHDYWYYARELKNNVINLRLPKAMFNNKSAKLTNFPDEYYKSGYLWKTLFPKDWGEDEIINAIRLALNNIDHEISSAGEFIGYAFKDEPFEKMRICVLYRDGKIKSAFPSWTQPCTGNNGKPYSHFDSIGYVLSESTLYFDSEHKLDEAPETKLFGEEPSLWNLPYNTPKFIIEREFVGKEKIDEWSDKKNYRLMEYAGEATENDILTVKEYLSDDLITKNNYITSRYVYSEHYFNIICSKNDFNAFHFHQNIIDSLIVIGFYDNFKGTRHAHDVISFLMGNMATHTGCLDSWNKKRIFNTIIEIVLSHHDMNLCSNFINWLVDSPWKRELFIDINCGVFDKLDLNPENVLESGSSFHPSLSVIHVTEQPIKCKINHFMHFYILSLGETYLMNFKSDMLVKFFNDNNDESLKNYISDSIKFTRSKDLMLFSEQFKRITQHIISNNIKGLEDSVILSIFKDYHRIQSAQRCRNNLYYNDVSNYEIDYGDPENIEFIRAICLKHERLCNQFSIDLFFDMNGKLGDHLNSEKIKREIAKQKKMYFKMVPPLPDFTHNRM